MDFSKQVPGIIANGTGYFLLSAILGYDLMGHNGRFFCWKMVAIGIIQVMPTVAKKSNARTKRRRSSGAKLAAGKLKASRSPFLKRTRNLKKRKEIGKILNMASFLAGHKRNAAATAAHWETKD